MNAEIGPQLYSLLALVVSLWLSVSMRRAAKSTEDCLDAANAQARTASQSQRYAAALWCDIRAVVGEHISLLERAENFISGFEDDERQEGVPELLRDLREAIATTQEQLESQHRLDWNLTQRAQPQEDPR